MAALHYYYYSYFCLFSILHVNVYIMNNFSLYLTYWRVGISCLDHLFLDDFPMVFIPCFHPDVMEINFRFYFSNAIIRKVFFILRIALFLPRNVLFDLSLLKHEFNSSTYIYIRGFFMFFNWYANNALCCMISLLCLFLHTYDLAPVAYQFNHVRAFAFLSRSSDWLLLWLLSKQIISWNYYTKLYYKVMKKLSAIGWNHLTGKLWLIIWTKIQRKDVKELRRHTFM